jgi:tetratricopeptide (TPR) repeat protein
VSPVVDPARWRVIEPLLDGALEREGEARQAFLVGLESNIRRQVETLLAECERPPELLDTAIAERFAALILDSIPPPATLGGRYRIERVLGRGGMATVYLARDLHHSRDVAVKVLGPDVSAQMTRARFQSEIQIAAGLTHPNILGVHDSGETDGHLFYVMPYVAGESLRHRLNRAPCLSVENALAIASEIAGALSHAHANGIIHRDIKPENILLESGHAVVADFGIARAIDSALNGSVISPVSPATGTPAYMSPEQARSVEIDSRADLYSLGCVLFEMLTGAPPFVGPDTNAVIHQHITMPPPSIAQRRPDLPVWVAAAIERTLAKDPTDRFESAAQFAASLVPARGLSPSAAADLPSADARPLTTAGKRALQKSLLWAIVLVLGMGVLDSREHAPVRRLAGRSDSTARRPVALDHRATEAYDDGVYFLSRRSADDRARAVTNFSRAVTLEPRFAAAHARLAEAYAAQAYFGYPGASISTVAFARAESALATALQMDANLAEAHVTLAKLRWMHAPRLSEAETAIHRALALDTLGAEAQFEHARLLAIRGFADSAISAVARARTLDRSSSVRAGDIAWVYWVVRLYPRAIETARAAIRLDSTASTAYLALGGALIGQRKYHDAIVPLERGYRLSGRNTLFLPQLGYAHAMNGDTSEARATLQQLLELHAAGRASAYYVAQVYVALGEKERALGWLEKAVSERSGHVVFLNANAVWDPIRRDPRFQAITALIGLTP